MPLTREEHEARFWGKVEKTDSCWLWRGTLVAGGYGQIKQDGKTRYSHRVAFAWANGPIPEGLEVDHLCRTPGCVNPDHLEAVTREENMARSIARCAKITHCPQGHEYTAENTQRGSRKQKVHRACATCHRDKERARRERSKELLSR